MRRIAAVSLYFLSFYREKSMPSVLDTALFAFRASEASAAFFNRFVINVASIPTASQVILSVYNMAATSQLYSTSLNNLEEDSESWRTLRDAGLYR